MRERGNEIGGIGWDMRKKPDVGQCRVDGSCQETVSHCVVEHHRDNYDIVML